MCTVLLRFQPGAPWPLVAGAVRDEFADRAWDPPAAHWPPPRDRLIGGRDRTAGGTWLAVDPDTPALAAVLNGVRLPPPPRGNRPSRGGLPLAALSGELPDDPAELARYDGFHLLHATAAWVRVWSWDGVAVRRRDLSPGDHILVNDGVDAVSDPLVPHFAPLLRETKDPDPYLGWGGWVDLLAGDGLDPEDPRALLIRREANGRVFGSTSECLVALAPGRARFHFSADPARAGAWYPVPLG